jgi:ribose/xylose/arabinose/galactoside ABC-type transport system permease subunit
MKPTTKQWIYAGLAITAALAGVIYTLFALISSSRPERGIVLAFSAVFAVLFFFWEREKSRNLKANQ